MHHHLAYDWHEPSGHLSGNSPMVIAAGDHGEIDLQTPRDRNATFEPQLIQKSQSRFTGMGIKF